MMGPNEVRHMLSQACGWPINQVPTYTDKWSAHARLWRVGCEYTLVSKDNQLCFWNVSRRAISQTSPSEDRRNPCRAVIYRKRLAKAGVNAFPRPWGPILLRRRILRVARWSNICTIQNLKLTHSVINLCLIIHIPSPS